MPSHASRQAPGDPGRQKMKVAPATPAVARLCTVEAPILAWLSIWKAIEKPSIGFSNNGSTASGVTSRPVKPVPPVVMTASMPGSAIHFLTTAQMASTSSVTISRAASLWPAAVSRSASVVPDLSSASERVSEIVSTAMLSGTNCFASSIEDIALYLSCPGRGAASFTLLRGAGTHTLLYPTMGPGSAAHHHSVSKTRVNALMAVRSVRGTETYSVPAPNVLQACTVPSL